MSPRDFLEDNQQNTSRPSMAMGAGSPRDFLEEHEEPKQSYWESVKSAPGKINSDVSSNAWKGINAIPGYYEKAKTEIPGIFNAIKKHPLHTLGQEFAGINEAINSLAQAPLNISRYASNRLNLLPESVTNAIQKISPEDTTQSINKLFGNPKYAGEAALRGAARNILPIGGAAKIASAIKPSTLFTSKKSIKNSLLNPHDALENRATNTFNKVSDEVNNRGINKIPMESNFDPEFGIKSADAFFDNMKQYFPDTRSSKKLINDAKTGDYNALRKLQSDLYTKGKQNLGSSLESDRMKGAEMFEKRNDINQTISNHLKSTGNHDLDTLLNQARNDWSTLQKTYYNENMNNALVNMFDINYRKVPTNLVDLLGEESIPMKNLLDFHPGLESKIQGYKRGRNFLGKGLKYGIPAAAAFAGYEYGKPRGRG